MHNAFFWLMVFDASQAALIVLALTPPKFWASSKPRAALIPGPA